MIFYSVWKNRYKFDLGEFATKKELIDACNEDWDGSTESLIADGLTLEQAKAVFKSQMMNYHATIDAPKVSLPVFQILEEHFDGDDPWDYGTHDYDEVLEVDAPTTLLNGHDLFIF